MSTPRPTPSRRRPPSSFVAFIRKEGRHILRDRRTMVILLGMPVVLMLLFGFAIRNEIDDIPTVVIDFAGDEATAELVRHLGASSHFTLVDVVHTDADLERRFQHGEVKLAVLFGHDFGRKLLRHGTPEIRLVADATDPNMANTMTAYASVVLREALTAQTGVPARPLVSTEISMRYNPMLRSANLFVPGLIAVVLMLVSALMTSITITREKEMGTMEVLLVSPLRPSQIIIGKVIPYVGLSLANLVTILVLARTVFDVPIRGSLLLLLVESLIFIVSALSLGIMISSVSRTMQVATMIALAGLMLPTMVLSGFIFPIESMPVLLQGFSHIVPATWFLEIIRSIMLRGQGLDQLWPQTLVLIGMTVVFLTVSIRSFNIRLEQ